MRKTLIPVSRSPARMARSIGAAPRQRGSSEACRLTQPRRGASRMGLGQEQAVGADDGEVGAEGGELPLRLGVLQRARRADLEAQALGRVVDGRAAEPVPATGGAGRLGVDGGDLVAGGEEGVEAGQDEAGRAHHDEAERRRVRHARAGS